MSFGVRVEICVDSAASAIAAEHGGAARVELCSSLNDGGLTPSAGLIETVRLALALHVHVMIRPRAGDFCYDACEFDTMKRDIAAAKKLGANGVVFGILDIDANVDIERTRQLVELARPLAVTFHRAFDMTTDLVRALEDVCAAGADRILTSGGQPTAHDNRALIADLIRRAQGRIVIMPGSGIKPDNARSLIAETGARELHASLRTSTASPMRVRNQRLTVGSVDAPDYRRFIVREEDVRNLCRAVAEKESQENLKE